MMPPPNALLVAIFALTLCIGGVSTDALAGKRRGPPDIVEDARAFATTDRSKAIELLETAIADGPSSRDLSAIQVEAGEHRRLAGDIDPARAWFDQVLGHNKRGAEREAALLGVTLIDAAGGINRKQVRVLSDVSDKDALPTQNADRYMLLAADAATRGESGRVSANSRRALTWAVHDAEVLTRIEATIAALAAGDPPPEVGDPPASGPTGAASSFVLDKAEAAWAAGDRDQAVQLATKASRSSDPAVSAQAKAMVLALNGREDPNRIVVLLPLEGKYGAVGKQVRGALEYGYGSTPRRLDFIDTGGTSDGAVAALERAASEGAIAVVGALLSDETDAMAAAADRLNIPLISLSQSLEVPTDYRWVLQGMFTRADQVKALLDFAVNERGFKSFAVFNPDNDFGTHAAELFTAGAEARGAVIKTRATYLAGEDNLLPYAKELGERQGNLRALRAQAEERGGNPDTVVIPPIINFEALFLPESASRTPLACAALAYEEFPMGDFQPTRDSPKVPLLGLATWNTQNLVTQGNEYTRNSLFPDAFSSSAAGDADPFVVAYRGSTGRNPTALEAATVDVGKLLAAAARSDAQTRPGFRGALLAAEAPDAVTGATQFNPQTRRAVRTMRILTITRQTVEEVGEISLDGT